MYSVKLVNDFSFKNHQSFKLWYRQGNRKSSKFYCDFKFRSATFNEGYVGGDIIVGMTTTQGYEMSSYLAFHFN